MFIAAGGLGLKQSGLATLVRRSFGSVVAGMVGPVVRWSGGGFLASGPVSIFGSGWKVAGSVVNGVGLVR